MNRSLLTTRRAAFTMIELLIVIAIIGIMASAMLFSMGGLLQEGNVARTQAQIAQIDMLINERWENYRTRSVPIRLPVGAPPRVAATLRWAAIRDLMRTELPERLTDVQDLPISLPPTNAPPALQRKYQRLVASRAGGYAGWSLSYQGAECLYMILECIPDGEGNALNFFAKDEVGDIDGDKMPEILDAWGRPIEFLRWAPGFESDRQVRDATVAPNPFDPFKTDAAWSQPSPDRRPFLLYPLIFSAGADGKYEIAVDDVPAIRYRSMTPPNNPYYMPATMLQNGVAVDVDGDGAFSHYDNLHNHLLEVK